MSHTPGPWRESAFGNIVSDAHFRGVDHPIVWGLRHGWATDDDKRLAIASPLLLEACEAVNALWSEWYPPDVFGLTETDGQVRLREVWALIRTALSMAKGDRNF